jgi:hypothetical protein
MGNVVCKNEQEIQSAARQKIVKEETKRASRYANMKLALMADQIVAAFENDPYQAHLEDYEHMYTGDRKSDTETMDRRSERFSKQLGVEGADDHVNPDCAKWVQRHLMEKWISPTERDLHEQLYQCRENTQQLKNKLKSRSWGFEYDGRNRSRGRR